MSNRCQSLDGTERYAYGTRKNPPTKIQQNCIDIIEKNLGIKFNGHTSKQAYDFIGDHYDRAVGRRRYR
jgi:protein-tyrosine-phosphatase